MFRIDVLAAEYGDALWIEYGAKAAPLRMLIDCGTASVYESALEERFKSLKDHEKTFELFVVTHVDIDHIGGAVKLLKNREKLGITFKEIWFNGYKQLEAASDILGPVQGEELTQKIVEQKLTWNAEFDKGPVMVPPTGPLPSKLFEGGMTLTLLSPYAEQLDKLKPKWEDAVLKAGIVLDRRREDDTTEDESDILGLDIEALSDSRFKKDPAEANGSSIAFIAEHDGKRVLFAADAHVQVLLDSLQRLPLEMKQLDAFKIAHHGSTHNTSRELLEAVSCRDYLISSNGKRFKHPNQEAIARIIRWGGRKPTLHFNYRSKFNEVWDDATMRRDRNFPYATRYAGSEGISLNLLP